MTEEENKEKHAVPVLLYGFETWIPAKKHLSRIHASEMRFLRFLKGCTRRDRFYNEDIRKKLNIFNIQDRITENKERWVAHLNRIPDGRLPKEVWKYKPIENEVQKELRSVSEMALFLQDRNSRMA